MKKLFVLTGAVVLSSTLFAQKPSSSDAKYSLEGNINYDATNGFSWTAPNLRARYFINDNIAARVQLGLGSSSEKSLYYAANDSTFSSPGTIVDKSSSWTMQLGAEYHLKGTDKLSPYFMAGINFGGMSMSTKGTNVDEIIDPINDAIFEDGSTHEMKTSSSMFGIGLGAGMDYYVFDNVYLGLELGWGWSRINDKGGSYSSTTAGGSSEGDIPSLGSNSNMGTGAMNTAFRIGWRF
jgi:outer membrane protein W